MQIDMPYSPQLAMLGGQLQGANQANERAMRQQLAMQQLAMQQKELESKGREQAEAMAFEKQKYANTPLLMAMQHGQTMEEQAAGRAGQRGIAALEAGSREKIAHEATGTQVELTDKEIAARSALAEKQLQAEMDRLNVEQAGRTDLQQLIGNQGIEALDKQYSMLGKNELDKVEAEGGNRIKEIQKQLDFSAIEGIAGRAHDTKMHEMQYGPLSAPVELHKQELALQYMHTLAVADTIARGFQSKGEDYNTSFRRALGYMSRFKPGASSAEVLTPGVEERPGGSGAQGGPAGVGGGAGGGEITPQVLARTQADLSHSPASQQRAAAAQQGMADSMAQAHRAVMDARVNAPINMGVQLPPRPDLQAIEDLDTGDAKTDDAFRNWVWNQRAIAGGRRTAF